MENNTILELAQNIFINYDVSFDSYISQNGVEHVHIRIGNEYTNLEIVNAFNYNCKKINKFCNKMSENCVRDDFFIIYIETPKSDIIIERENLKYTFTIIKNYLDSHLEIFKLDREFKKSFKNDMNNINSLIRDIKIGEVINNV